MKVLHVLNSSAFSGAENVACLIINLLNTVGVESYYCSPTGSIEDALIDRNIKYVPVKRLTKHALEKVINEVQPDVIHAHDAKASFIASLVECRARLISHMHGNCKELSTLSLKSIGYRYATKKIDRIIWLSNLNYGSYLFHNEVSDKSTVIPNIVDRDSLTSLAKSTGEQKRFDLIYLGRITKVKNPSRFIHIVSLIKERIPSIRVAMVGDGDLKSRIEKECKKLGITENITFFGFLDNPFPVLRESRTLVMTSLSEGLPMCALEAMALSVPVFAVPTDGLNDIIQNGYNGYLSDNDRELADAIIECITHKEVEAKYQKGTQEFSAIHNNKERYIAELLEVYQSTVCQGVLHDEH